MKWKQYFTKASLKSNLRHVYVGVFFVYTAAQTYLAKGNTFGLNKETFYGIGAQVGIALSAIVMKYIDKSDPSMGIVTHAAAAEVNAKLEPLTEPKKA